MKIKVWASLKYIISPRVEAVLDIPHVSTFSGKTQEEKRAKQVKYAQKAIDDWHKSQLAIGFAEIERDEP